MNVEVPDVCSIVAGSPGIGAMGKQSILMKTRTYDDDKSKELMNVFFKNQDRWNDFVVNAQSEKWANGPRWVVAKPRAHGGPSQWGCGCCHALVNSKQFQDARASKKLNMSNFKSTLAFSHSTAVPTVHNLREHMMSGLHELALDFCCSAGSVSLTNFRPSLTRSNDRWKGVPSPREMVELWFHIKRRMSSRDLSSKTMLDSWLSSITDAGKIVTLDQQFVTKAAQSFAEAIRGPYRAFAKRVEGHSITFDGFAAFDEIICSSIDLESLKPRRTLSSMAEPYTGT